jgi:hypothetical protein
MRFLLAALAVLLMPATAFAQGGYRPPDIAAQRAAMERLAPLLGRWQGEALVQQPQTMTVYQTEQVELALDGIAMLVRGTGHANAERSGAPVFQALAVLSYDDVRRIYEFRTYARGYAATATGEFLDDGSFRWSISPGGPVRIRYTITITGDQWREIGEMSYDNGTTWAQTIDMNLRRLP